MPELDPIIHAPNRLRICAMLATSAELDFRLLKAQLAVSDSVLSKQLKALEDANYIEAKKRSHNGRPRTWVSLTDLGQSAFHNHVAALKRIINE